MMPRSLVAQEQRQQEEQQQRPMQELSPLHLSSPSVHLPTDWTPASSSEVRGATATTGDSRHISSSEFDNQENNQLSAFGNEPPRQWHQQQQTRSSPIAIIRNPLEQGAALPPGEAIDDDDDSSINVERDALKLKELYGAKIVGTSFEDPLDPLVPSNNLLKAPYLGSLSQSAPFSSHDMPPITLSLAGHSGHHRQEDPPSDLTCSSVGMNGDYGSLRESHQRGLFLDGPASYRDGRSGEIRPLNHRRRFTHHGSAPSVSIGERMQQSRQRKEKLQKQRQKERARSGTTTSATNCATSSLSAMMDEASKSEALGHGTIRNDGYRSNSHLHSINDTDARHGFPFTRYDDDGGPSMMMSTSLTGLELLMSSKRMTMAVGDVSGLANQNASVGMAGLIPPRHVGLLPADPSQHEDANETIQSTVGGTEEYHQHQFQALARSMSDPTPHLKKNSSIHQMQPQLQQRQPQLPAGRVMSQAIAPGWSHGQYSLNGVPSSGDNAVSSADTPMVSVPLPLVAPSQDGPLGYTTVIPMTGSSAIATSSYGMVGRTTPRGSLLDHNPDTDGAFDMDME